MSKNPRENILTRYIFMKKRSKNRSKIGPKWVQKSPKMTVFWRFFRFFAIFCIFWKITVKLGCKNVQKWPKIKKIEFQTCFYGALFKKFKSEISFFAIFTFPLITDERFFGFSKNALYLSTEQICSPDPYMGSELQKIALFPGKFGGRFLKMTIFGPLFSTSDPLFSTFRSNRDMNFRWPFLKFAYAPKRNLNTPPLGADEFFNF